MEFTRFYVVLLKKGPNWTGEASPRLDELQERHLAHIRSMHEAGKLATAGPVEDHSERGEWRGISIFHADEFASLDELRALVEQDSMFEIGHLAADYLTWYTQAGTTIG